jgi:hypothetical protein
VVAAADVVVVAEDVVVAEEAGDKWRSMEEKL